MNKDYSITYIYHSCFCIEFDKVVFIFDYFKGELPNFESEKTIYFLSSHKHYDHFDICIFDYIKNHPNTKYILSNDIKLTDKYLKNNNIPVLIRDSVVSIGKNETIDIDNIYIETLESTDRGVAFIIRYNDKIFYHGGDLNWWYKEHETSEYNNKMEKSYKEQINKIKNYCFDVAFVPLDGRQNTGYYFGFDYFMKNIETKYVIPMHLWENYNTIDILKSLDFSKEYRHKIIDVKYENQQII